MELPFLWIEFDDGKVTTIRTHESLNGGLNDLLNIDDGAAFIGEMGVGVNGKIQMRIGDAQWDENALGTMHFVLGGAQGSLGNGNRSLIRGVIVTELADKKLFVNDREVAPGWFTK
jgi:leucyl aminopeptidase (aminopeptidase T)